MRFLHNIEDQIARPGVLSRRVLLNRAAKGCAALAAIAAGVRFDIAHATQYGCCTLVYSLCEYEQCPCSSSQNYYWQCRDSSNGCIVQCVECYGCNPPCSYVMQLCSPGCPCAPGALSVEEAAKLGPFRLAGERCH